MLITRYCPLAPIAAMSIPEHSDPITMPICMATELRARPLRASLCPTMSYVSDWRVVKTKAMAAPPMAISAIMCQSSATSTARAAAMAPVDAALARETIESNLWRSIRSATAPDIGPRKKNGAIPKPEATPTMKGDSVISKISQPETTQFMPMEAD